MKEKLLKQCELYTENCEKLKESFENSYSVAIIAACAASAAAASSAST